MVLHWPQLVWITLACISVGTEIAKHGRPRTGTHNAVSLAIAFCLMYGLLYAGGFFTEVHP